MRGRFASSLLPVRAPREIFGTGGALPDHAPRLSMAPSGAAPVRRRHERTLERRLGALGGADPMLRTTPENTASE